MELQTPDRAAVEDIFQALMRMLDKSPAPQMRLVEPAAVYSHLYRATADKKLWVLGDFAILVDVGPPWHTTKPVLIEEIIVRFRRGHGGTVEDAVAALDRLAERFGCFAIAAGDTQIGMMAPRYTAAGFVTLGTQFYKETPNGVRS